LPVISETIGTLYLYKSSVLEKLAKFVNHKGAVWRLPLCFNY